MSSQSAEEGVAIKSGKKYGSMLVQANVERIPHEIPIIQVNGVDILPDEIDAGLQSDHRYNSHDMDLAYEAGDEEIDDGSGWNTSDSSTDCEEGTPKSRSIDRRARAPNEPLALYIAQLGDTKTKYESILGVKPGGAEPTEGVGQTFSANYAPKDEKKRSWGKPSKTAKNCICICFCVVAVFAVIILTGVIDESAHASEIATVPNQSRIDQPSSELDESKESG